MIFFLLYGLGVPYLLQVLLLCCVVGIDSRQRCLKIYHWKREKVSASPSATASIGLENW